MVWQIWFQAQAALMYDAVFVLVEAFNKLLKKKPDQFRSYTMRRSSSQHSYTNSSYGNLIANGQQNMRVLDCNIAKGWINPWEHGDKISRYLRKVRSYMMTLWVFTVLCRSKSNIKFKLNPLAWISPILCLSGSA